MKGWLKMFSGMKPIYEIVGIVSSIIFAISTFIGGIFWLASVDSKATAASVGVAEVRDYQESFQNSQNTYNREIIGRLSRIEQGVEILLDERKTKKE